jgi:hypothetical protein
MAAELAGVRASLATAEASAARKVQDYNQNLEKIQREQKVLQARRDEALADRDAAHQSLSVAVAEKERLIKEVADLKEICDELMVMVEKGTPQT